MTVWPTAPAVQRGGSSDLDVLWDELANWPGYYVENITPTACYGSNDPTTGERRDDAGSYHSRGTDSWCIEVEQDGWEPRDRWLMWGSSIADAAKELAEFMRERRLNPHLVHIEESEFRTGCLDCERDARDYFDNDVEWSA